MDSSWNCLRGPRAQGPARGAGAQSHGRVRAAGLTRAAISRLENGWTVNPTLETLYRYALALDAHIALAAEDIENDHE